jgi:hypothetical protein
MEIKSNSHYKLCKTKILGGILSGNKELKAN